MDEAGTTGTGRHRRGWLAGLGVGVAALAAGGGWSWWRLNALPVVDAAALDALWQARFEQPDGGTLRLADQRGRPLLVNFWATWCPPCVKEMPLLAQFQRERQAAGWQVVGIAIDKAEPVRRFLQQRPVGFPVGLAGWDTIELSRRLGNAGGQLPFTVVLRADGRLHDRHLGAVDEARLARWADGV
ncbi:TlpA disulfide reductase family protein [Piscinibacter sakaiensis]|uniref:Cytochrome c-type biogenesis protein ResA n=1 Tax=Piscinibacter sakaiensis TaxID=1547922 RepID=A0A0K8NYA2_PISS1|nr:TlpA disulfide reductase family protein [Piscinibacter sakaiensis]GAP35269.1 cytochrome c-type biogenesis protein ResA [Piscinibacter sakaiensis]